MSEFLNRLQSRVAMFKRAALQLKREKQGLQAEVERFKQHNNDMGAEYSSLERHYKRIAEDERVRAEALQRRVEELELGKPEFLRLFLNELLSEFKCRDKISKSDITDFTAKRIQQLRADADRSVS